MKPALFYAIRRNSMYKPVVAITSTKPGRWNGEEKWYGRYTANVEATHGKMSDLSGRFDTLEEAERHRAAIAAITKRYNAQRDVLMGRVNELYRDERLEIDALT